ncbi:hypothetical protein K469DRAFT_625740 [Zopfia rhizophila CBS 207.26]|uniref:Nuclear pore assembly and biogenesis-domain-containing protein n=1 Tax=Zopfia rhizophila CBS 207.26 TaxID=1314779 RepID=A0A6A6EGK1_9PEZI|nr:hypothetical protein K469DRAFT_625740 [Zopfia rhizophila CBS 207.26]
MDFLQDYLQIVPNLLPPSLLNPVITVITTTFGIMKTLQTHLTPLLTRVTTQPDVASILMLLAILFISLKILEMAYRTVMFWVNLVFKVLLWGSIAGVSYWIYTRGLDGFVEDVQHLVEVWLGEYEKFNEDVRRYQQQQQVRMDGYGHQKGRRVWR